MHGLFIDCMHRKKLRAYINGGCIKGGCAPPVIAYRPGKGGSPEVMTSHPQRRRRANKGDVPS